MISAKAPLRRDLLKNVAPVAIFKSVSDQLAWSLSHFQCITPSPCDTNQLWMKEKKNQPANMHRGSFMCRARRPDGGAQRNDGGAESAACWEKMRAGVKKSSACPFAWLLTWELEAPPCLLILALKGKVQRFWICYFVSFMMINLSGCFENVRVNKIFWFF